MKLRGTDPVPHRPPLTPGARASPHGVGRDAPSRLTRELRRRATPDDVVARRLPGARVRIDWAA